MANEKRLIDANALKPMFDRREADDVEFFGGVYIPECFPADDAKEIVDQMPTVDAVEVIHAHWEDGYAIHNGKEVYKSIDCSHCNEIFKTDDREYWKARFKVCPFCGSLMDGDGNG